MQLPLETRRTKQAKRENKNRRNNKENKETREKQNKEQNKTRAGGAGGPEAEQLHAYTCDGQCNCAHASKSTQDFHRPEHQHYKTTRVRDTPTFAKSVSLKKYIACMYV